MGFYSSRKPYLDLEKSQVEFFTGLTRFLKQALEKESMFEKPYLDLEYPSMQLRLPRPRWPSLKPRGPVGAFGPIERDLRWRHIFPPPSCGIISISGLRGGAMSIGSGFGGTTGYGFGLDCGDVSVLSFRADSFFAIESWSWVFSLSSGDLDVGAIISQIVGNTISLLTETPGVAGTVRVCATGSGGQTPLVWETTYREGERVRLFSGPPRIWNQLATQEAKVRCCEEVLFNCDACIGDGAMAYDYETSAATIDQGNSVAIAVTGLNAPFEWSVSGAGFTLANATTEGLSNTLIADNSACGPATITVTGCDGTSVTGYVRCTTGSWSGYTNGCKLSGVPDTTTWDITVLELEKTEGLYNQDQQVGACAGTDIGGCDATDCSTKCTDANCVNCTPCMTFSCTEMFGGYVDCQAWCCVNVGYDCDEGSYCIGNHILRWREWQC